MKKSMSYVDCWKVANADKNRLIVYDRKSSYVSLILFTLLFKRVFIHLDNLQKSLITGYRALFDNCNVILFNYVFKLNRNT